MAPPRNTSLKLWEKKQAYSDILQVPHLRRPTLFGRPLWFLVLLHPQELLRPLWSPGPVDEVIRVNGQFQGLENMQVPSATTWSLEFSCHFSFRNSSQASWVAAKRAIRAASATMAKSQHLT